MPTRYQCMIQLAARCRENARNMGFCSIGHHFEQFVICITPIDYARLAIAIDCTNSLFFITCQVIAYSHQ